MTCGYVLGEVLRKSALEERYPIQTELVQHCAAISAIVELLL